VSKSINKDQVYTSGRYFLGLGKAFLEFPRSEQTIDFSTSCTSRCVQRRSNCTTLILAVAVLFFVCCICVCVSFRRRASTAHGTVAGVH